MSPIGYSSASAPCPLLRCRISSSAKPNRVRSRRSDPASCNSTIRRNKPPGDCTSPRACRAAIEANAITAGCCPSMTQACPQACLETPSPWHTSRAALDKSDQVAPELHPAVVKAGAMAKTNRGVGMKPRKALLLLDWPVRLSGTENQHKAVTGPGGGIWWLGGR